MLAAAAMAFSSVSVVSNAPRLKSSAKCSLTLCIKPRFCRVFFLTWRIYSARRKLENLWNCCRKSAEMVIARCCSSSEVERVYSSSEFQQSIRWRVSPRPFGVSQYLAEIEQLGPLLVEFYRIHELYLSWRLVGCPADQRVLGAGQVDR